MRALLALPALVLASCGGQQATPTAITLPTSSASASPIATSSAPDLSPVAAPDGLIATIRLSRPRHSIEHWSSLVTSLGVPSLAFDLDDVAKNEIGARIVAALDLDAPVDVVVMRASGSEWVPGGAVSLALNPGDAAMDLLARSFELQQKSDGSIVIRKAIDGGAADDDGDAGDDDEIADETKCVIAPPTGSASRRVVCAYGGVELSSVVPYLTRTLAREAPPLASDFRAEILVDKQRDMIRKLEGMADASSSSPSDDPAEAFGARFATEVGKTFVDDLDAVVFDATSDDEAISFSLSFRFGHATSVLTQALLSNGDGAAPARDAFWRLPSDTSFATFTHGASAKDLDPLREQLFTGSSGVLSAAGMPQTYIDLELGSARSVLLTGGPMVIGAGCDSTAARSALAAYVALGKDTLAARTKARAAMQGWTMVEVDEPATRWTAALKDMAAAEKIPVKRAHPPKPADADKEKSVTIVTPTPAALGLPTGTFHAERRTTPLPPAAKKAGDASMSFVATPPIAHTTHFFVVPDGTSTWLAIGEDAAVLAAHVKAALSTAPSAGTMKGKAGLERLAATRATSGAFATLAWIAQSFSDDDSDSDLKEASTLLDKIARWPARGATPIETYVTPLSRSEGGLGGRMITVRLPRAALGDIVKAF